MNINFLKKVASHLIWTRTHPTVLYPSYFTFVAIRKFLEDFAYDYKKSQWEKKLTVLDFGCWDQPYRYIFEQDNYIGCDIGDSPEKNDNMQILLEWEELPYESESFDIIVCTEVLEHLKDPEFYSKEFERVLKKWWIILLTVPQVWDYHPYPQHFFLYTPDGIHLFFQNEMSTIEIFWDSTPFQTGMMIAMMYSNWKIPLIKWFYILLINLLVLPFPKYRKYNHATSHIFSKMTK